MFNSEKICGKCKVSKPVHEFYKRTKSKDGLCHKCKQCATEYTKQYIKKNEEKVAERQKKYYALTIEKQKKYSVEYYIKNKEKALKKSVLHYQQNRDEILKKRQENKKIYNKRSNDYYHQNKNKCVETRKKWVQKNRFRLTAKQNYRYTSQKKRTPLWLNEQDLQKISDIYKQAAELTASTGIKHHVDHIIPLQGKTVSGLHVPHNLQVLNYMENIRKKNKYNEWGSDA